MKNIITILVGIVIGSGSTLLFQHHKISTTKKIIEQRTEGSSWLTEFTIDDIIIGSYNKSRMTLGMKGDSDLGVWIDLDRGIVFDLPEEGEPVRIYTITVHDKNGVTHFTDKNSDGIWDVKERRPWQTHVIDSDSLTDYVLPNGEFTGSFKKWKSEWKKEANQELQPTVKTPVESGNQQGTAAEL